MNLEPFGRRILFWLVWKRMDIRLGNIMLQDKSWAQKTGWLKMGEEWPEDTGVGSLRDEKGRREWVLCELLAGHRCICSGIKRFGTVGV